MISKAMTLLLKSFYLNIEYARLKRFCVKYCTFVIWILGLLEKVPFKCKQSAPSWTLHTQFYLVLNPVNTNIQILDPRKCLMESMNSMIWCLSAVFLCNPCSKISYTLKSANRSWPFREEEQTYSWSHRYLLSFLCTNITWQVFQSIMLTWGF